MKGFIFSIEALISVIVLLLFLAMVNFYFVDYSSENNYQITKIQNSQAIALYVFGVETDDGEGNNSKSESQKANRFCQSVIKKQDNELVKKEICV